MAAVLALGSTPINPGSAAIENPDVDVTADYRYEVDLEAGEVGVTIGLAVTADKPNQQTDDGTYQYFFSGTNLAIPGGVKDLIVADAAGNELRFETDDSIEGLTNLSISFLRNIFYGQTADINVSFVLPGGQARGEGLTRVNESYIGFEAWVDPRLESATVQVEAPGEFTARNTNWEWESEESVPENSDDESVTPTQPMVLTALDVDPEVFWSAVSLTREDKLVETKITVGEQSFDIKAWPGDTAWSNFVTEQLTEGLPVLQREIGLDWPLDDELAIIESFSPYLEGYAGWYDLRSNEIQIGDKLDRHVVFHELSHVWLNDELFRDRWITEGLADHFGANVITALGDDRPEPQPVEPNDDAAIPLDRWATTPGTGGESEGWAYAASWTLTEAIDDAVGSGVLTDVIQAAAKDEISYTGDNAAEPYDGLDDWRRYLDLIQNAAGSGDGRTDESVTDLFKEWVLPEGRYELLLDQRGNARAQYRALTTDGASWAPPLATRTAMSMWRFTDAVDQMEIGSEILDSRDQIITELEQVDQITDMEVGVPTPLEAAYESAETTADLSAVTAMVEEALDASEKLRMADDAIDNADGIVERIGSFGSGQQGELLEAATAFELGDFDKSRNLSDSVSDSANGLNTAGVVRIAIVMMTIGAALLARHQWARRRRTRRELESELAHQSADW